MKDHGLWILKRLHLIISVVIVLPTAIIYGTPSLLSERLDIQITTIDLSNMFKAIMCVYIGVSLVWIFGVFKIKYWKPATQLNVLFMLTLALGRAISMVVDGTPTDGYLFAIIAEGILGFFSIFQLMKYTD